MPKKETFSTQVQEQTEGETRLITATIMVPIQEFHLTDALKQRGAIPGIEGILKQAVREAVLAYLESAEDLIAGIAAGQKKGANGAKQKAKEAVNSGGNGGLNGAVNGGKNGVGNGGGNGAVSGAVSGAMNGDGDGAGNGHLTQVMAVESGAGDDVLALQ